MVYSLLFQLIQQFLHTFWEFECVEWFAFVSECVFVCTSQEIYTKEKTARLSGAFSWWTSVRPSSSPQSLKEGLTAEQRLHLFDNKDTKEFWQRHTVSADQAACLEGPLYFSFVMTYLVTLHTGHPTQIIYKLKSWYEVWISCLDFCIPCTSVTVTFFVMIFVATSYCKYCF